MARIKAESEQIWVESKWTVEELDKQRIEFDLLLKDGGSASGVGEIWGHYAAYEDELQRIWPLNMENRRSKIEQFAQEHGFRLAFYKSGLCAIFQKSH